MKNFLRSIIAPPVHISLKGKIFSLVACFGAIFLVAWLTQKLALGSGQPIIIASMGASAAMLFIIPHSPLAQPWSLVGGQLVSAFAGVWSSQVFTDKPLASACAVTVSVLLMLLFRCLHPPGAATALTPIATGDSLISLGYDFVLIPVALNAVIMLIMAIVINRWILRYEYPIFFHPPDNKIHEHNTIQPLPYDAISEQAMDYALDNMDIFMDVCASDLSKLLSNVQQQNFKRYRSNVTCADIMVKNILTVDYGTEVEEAWKMMRDEKLKAIPVIDKARRVIGIITWGDFFKQLKTEGNKTFREKFLTFVQRTPDIATHKPEAVGHIMTNAVVTLQESSHIVELVPLMLNQGYQQIPIVNTEKRLVGMVYQANLIATLYHTNDNHSQTS